MIDVGRSVDEVLEEIRATGFPVHIQRPDVFLASYPAAALREGLAAYIGACGTRRADPCAVIADGRRRDDAARGAR